ncbi:hypothetical protein NC651_016520 [Populus alba x Populus x berolinensis]|nr:hypothetical protein NC651_016520 [Populus alba x Populus x berolinensis]
MVKLSQQNTKNTAINRNNTTYCVTKVIRTRRSVPRDSPPQRSSIYRGVTRSIDGPANTKLICGIRITGMNYKTRKDDKVHLTTYISFIFFFQVIAQYK